MRDIEPHCVMTTAAVEEYETILSVGDTTFLDYRGIKVKREGYSPTGNGGNGLILHSALAIEPEQGQTIGLLWQKIWNREHKAKPLGDPNNFHPLSQLLGRWNLLLLWVVISNIGETLQLVSKFFGVVGYNYIPFAKAGSLLEALNVKSQVNRRLKIFRILAERYRNRRKRFGLRFNLISAILNFELASSS